jgi:DNA polymerase-3 subunit alpha
MHAKYGIPVIVTNDCHYCNKEDSEMQRIMLLVQTKKTKQEAEEEYKKAIETGNLEDIPFEYQDTNLWMKSEEEMNEKWEKDYKDAIDLDLFNQAKMNTVEICKKAKGVTLDRSVKLPKIPDAEEKLREAVINGFSKRGLPKTQEYLDRIKEEYTLICNKDFASYFLIEKMMVDEARRYWGIKTGNGNAAVGPGRGSAVGSLICYCLGITDVNPIAHDLLFSRFLSPVRGGKSMKLRFSIDPIMEQK